MQNIIKLYASILVKAEAEVIGWVWGRWVGVHGWVGVHMWVGVHGWVGGWVGGCAWVGVHGWVGVYMWVGVHGWVGGWVGGVHGWVCMGG